MIDRSRSALRLLTGAAIIAGILTRLAVFTWADPWGPHHPDEHILPLDAIALWEGVTPREVGWPASTTRLVLSAGAAAQWLAEEGQAAWRLRGEPDRALETVTTWIGNRYVDPTPLYRLGRATSVVTGILQVVATAWALSQWVGPGGVAIGTLAVAIGPLPVMYSQYVLADISGLLFVTILVGLAANPTPRRAIAMGALAGLAGSSKFHFGLWLLTPLLCIWRDHEADAARKWRTSLYALGAAAWVVLTLVPWFWLNPLLALKEFAGVVLVKLGNARPVGILYSNFVTIYAGLGALAWVGALVGAATVRGSVLRRMVPVFVPVLLATVVLVVSSTVFDRYGLVLLPGVAVLAAFGWDVALSSDRRPLRLMAVAAVGACAIATLMSLVGAERVAGEIDVDVLAKRWILTHVPRGRRVALHDEDNAFLPRAAGQLRQCVEYLETPAAYREKWLVVGVRSSAGDAQPMRSMVLSDESYAAYWCRRELDAQRDPGFYVVPYHSDLRFGAVLERDAVNEFRNGSGELTGGVDVLVMNRPIDVGLSPAQLFKTARGQRVIYLR
jgi:hypothetical protein